LADINITLTLVIDSLILTNVSDYMYKAPEGQSVSGTTTEGNVVNTNTQDPSWDVGN
jgi:hypothetical protein